MNRDFTGRNEAVEDTRSSLIIEASAGTGKTTALVGRVLHLVLQQGPDGPPLPIRNICAITYTEKAAGEMRLRLRHELEIRTGEKGETGERARAAVAELDAASISTIHSFCVSMLKERPFEAGLDPQFSALDEVQGEIFFREVWADWLEGAIERRDPVLEAALRGGLSLVSLQCLADLLRRHSIESCELNLRPPRSDDEVRTEAGRLLSEGHELIGMCTDVEDKLARLLLAALQWLGAPEAWPLPARKPGSVGSRGNWKGGSDTVARARGVVLQINQHAAEWSQLPQQRLLDRTVRWLLENFLPEWRAQKRARGWLDFDDQLWWAHELLRLSEAARREFQERYRVLLVDEFQDTDHLQLRILLLLACADPEVGTQAFPHPSPGRLFLVGDPKQSIYRFRGADIETYTSVIDAAGAGNMAVRKVELTRNLRSVPSILRFVDDTFVGRMIRADGALYQPDYLPFGGKGLRLDEPDPPSVFLLGERNDRGELIGSGVSFVTVEARRIARLLRQMHDSREWCVEERSRAGMAPGGGRRPPRYGEIAVLLPVLTHADELEEALQEASVPYVLEGGKFYYARSEVSSAITLLRALDNPNDTVALYGGLRSIFFGLSDADLLEALAAGQALDYRTRIPADSPLSFPFSLLRELHNRRHERPASETFEVLLRETRAREVLALHGLQSLANLGKLGRTLRTLQGASSFSRVVELVASMDEEGAAESESRLMEEHGDAVRILSIHRSKGLDFPIVLVAGLGQKRKNSVGDFLSDRHRLMEFALRVQARDGSLRTPGWETLEAAEKLKENAELMRLLYVALTRARDYLVVSTHHRGKPDSESGGWDACYGSTRLQPLADLLSSDDLKGGGLVRLIDGAMLDRVQLPPAPEIPLPDQDWIGALRSEQEELRRLVEKTPAAARCRPAGRIDEEMTGDEGAPDFARRRAVRLGIAFHEAMEQLDLVEGSNLEACAHRSSQQHNLDRAGRKRLADMIRTCLASPLMRRIRAAAIAGREVLREVPFVRSLRGEDRVSGIEEGKVDLLFRDEDGWVIVDYKTDARMHLTEERITALRGKYGPQLDSYRKAMAQIGIPVRRSCILLAETGETVEIPAEP